MRLEELKNELPETPDLIHNMIQEEVEIQVNTSNIIPIKGKVNTMNKKRTIVRGLVACAAVALVACGANYFGESRSNDNNITSDNPIKEIHLQLQHMLQNCRRESQVAIL